MLTDTEIRDYTIKYLDSNFVLKERDRDDLCFVLVTILNGREFFSLIEKVEDFCREHNIAYLDRIRDTIFLCMTPEQYTFFKLTLGETFVSSCFSMEEFMQQVIYVYTKNEDKRMSLRQIIHTTITCLPQLVLARDLKTGKHQPVPLITC